MMTISNNGIITLSKGDTFTIPLLISTDKKSIENKQYVLSENDFVYFGLMEANQSFSDAIVKKVYTQKDLNEDDEILIEFKHNDTKNLQEGTYYYQINLVTEVNNEITASKCIIEKTKFHII